MWPFLLRYPLRDEGDGGGGSHEGESHEPVAAVEHVAEETAGEVDDVVVGVLRNIEAGINGVKAELEAMSGKLDRAIEEPKQEAKRRFGYRK